MNKNIFTTGYMQAVFPDWNRNNMAAELANFTNRLIDALNDYSHANRDQRV